MGDRSEADRVLRGEHRVFTGVGEDHRFVGTARQRARAESLWRDGPGYSQPPDCLALARSTPFSSYTSTQSVGRYPRSPVLSMSTSSAAPPAAVLAAAAELNCTVRVPEF